jgi:hypothetical protein
MDLSSFGNQESTCDSGHDSLAAGFEDDQRINRLVDLALTHIHQGKKSQQKMS